MRPVVPLANAAPPVVNHPRVSSAQRPSRSSIHLTMEPGSRGAPVAGYGNRGYVEYLCRLREGQSSEKTKLHHFRFPWIEFGQTFQSVVENHHVNASSARELGCVFQGQCTLTRAPFPGTVTAGVVDQNLPYQMRSDGKKMGAAFPLRRIHPNQAQVRLVYQFRALQAMVFAFFTQLEVCDPT